MQGNSLREYYLRRKGRGKYQFKYLPEDEVVIKRNGTGIVAKIDAITNLRTDGKTLYNLILCDGTYAIGVSEVEIFKLDKELTIPVQLPLRI